MKRVLRCAIAMVMGASIASSVVVAPASASTDLDLVVMEETAPAGEASPYVEAGSSEEANRILDALDASGTNSQVTAAAATVQFGPCVLYPTVVYLRTSSNKKAVGFKPYTKCSVPVSKIRHESDLRYKWYIWWRKAGSTFTGGNTGVASYTQTNIAYYCKGTSSTTWAGTTLGTIVYGGKTYYARVYPTSDKLACKA